MNKKNIFQYVSSIIKHNLLIRLISRASKTANIILDLEDSIQDVTKENNTKILKEQARENLKLLITNNPNLKVGIRINNINSSEYNKDLELISKFKNIEWSYIVLPKIESYSEIQQIIKDLSSINYKEIIICIESEQAVNNLEGILKNINRNKISKIQFGHFDFFLDRGTFPIPEQLSEVFWEICKPLIHQVEKEGFTYLHSPISALNSKLLTNTVVHKLNTICDYGFGFATLSINQNTLLTNYDESFLLTLPITNTDINKVKYANDIIESFTNNNSSFSFIHKDKNQVFIPPQQYYSAIKFLNNR